MEFQYIFVDLRQDRIHAPVERFLWDKKGALAGSTYKFVRARVVYAQSIIVWLLHIKQFTVCATKNLTVFVADSPWCLEWSSIAATSWALRDIFFIEI